MKKLIFIILLLFSFLSFAQTAEDQYRSGTRANFEDYRGLGFVLPTNDRGSYKIDHYIPLCAGGSNSTENLWPQHKSVYEITDPIEPLLCEKMSEGRLKQAEAVQLIKKVKNDLSKADEVMDYLNRL